MSRNYLMSLVGIDTPENYEEKRENIFKCKSEMNQRIIAKNLSRKIKGSIRLIECYENGECYLYEFENGILAYSGLMPTTLEVIDEIEEEEKLHNKIN